MIDFLKIIGYSKDNERGKAMFRNVLEYIDSYQMIQAEDTIIAGISGGADSVCLFTVLMKLQKERNFTVQVVHVNHGIRTEATDDANFVEKLCAQHRIPFHLVEADVQKLAREQHLSEEEAGRRVRYEAFEKLAEELEDSGSKPVKIAVAHNKNDRAETQLFHLFRGSGLRGLGGIPPVRGRIIRPLLCVERKEIEAFLAEQGIPYCTDATNEEDSYTRNKIRHHILPFAEQEVCEKAIAHMNEAAELSLELDSYMEKVSKDFSKNCISKQEADYVSIRVNVFLEAEEIIQKYVVRQILGRLTKTNKDITMTHTKDIISLFTKQVGKIIILPYGLTARREYEEVVIGRQTLVQKDTSKEENQQLGIEIPIPGSVDLPTLGTAEFTLLLPSEVREIPQKTYTKWFDYDKIEKSFQVRTRQSGDYLTINESMGRQSIKAYFINEKLSQQERSEQLLLADGNHIVWVIGRRISQYYKVTEQTKTILQVQIKEQV